MHNFTYEIRLTDEGIPYIHLPEDFEQKPEHWFMIYEMARYALYDLLDKNVEKKDLTDESIIKIAEAGDTIRQISEEYGKILKGMMDSLDDLDDSDGMIQGKEPDNE